MKKSLKKIIFASAAIITLGASATVSVNTVNASTAKSETLDGGWQVNQGSLSLNKNQRAKAALDKALDGLVGYSYKPIAYLGSQVVAGNNYSYLCKGSVVVPKAKSEYFILNVYEDLKGNAKITGTTNLLKTSSKKNAWKFNQGNYSLNKNAKVKAAFNKATKKLAGTYQPVAYVGKHGNNYAIFCAEKGKTSKAKRSYKLVIVNQKSKKSKVTQIKNVDLAIDAKK
ncbi:MAG: hypothetical protein ACI4T3_05200 [Lactobacillus sp.]